MRIVIIGGGAAGFFAAITCAEDFPGHEVIILEKSRSVLSKVRISGGGRCNVTHACYNHRQLSGYYPRGHRQMPALLSQFDAQATVHWFERRGVALKTEPDGRIFPASDRSETIIDCLANAAKRAGVQIRTSAGVKSVLIQGGDRSQTFTIQLLDDSTVCCDRVLIATGGNPNAQAYDWLTHIPESASHALQTPVPSLFTFNTPDSPLLDLAGISVPKALLRIKDSELKEEGPLLLTHWGFSGPAILRLSAWGARELRERHYDFTLLISWLPEYNDETLRKSLMEMRNEHKKKIISAHAYFGLPHRLWKRLLTLAGISDELRWADLPNKQLNKWVDLLLHSSFSVRGKSTFKEEFVTCGGIDLTEVDLQTMESKRCPGLYFAGEVLDIDGVTGGFNFQSAWTTGYIAGKHMGQLQTLTTTSSIASDSHA